MFKDNALSEETVLIKASGILKKETSVSIIE